ncbi:MAG: hypothetical protein U9N62_02800 [Thermotogota bacterium]|nr:hypothetical protein [Thermotogota bacterium]
MKLEIEIKDLFDSEKDMLTLKSVLECEKDIDMIDKLKGISHAAIKEYLDMLLGKNLPTRANEVQERRLFHLLNYYFKDRIPSESEIASIFQITINSSKTLLRNVRTKFRYQLVDKINNSIKVILKQSSKKNDRFVTEIQNENLLEEIRQVVSKIAPNLEQIKKVQNSACLFSISEDTLDVLCDHYDLSLDEITVS